MSIMDYTISRFRWSLQALAAPAQVQLELFPGFVLKVDELAIEFDQWYQVVKRRRTIFTPKQRKILEKLNRQLDDISGPDNLHYWMEETLRTDTMWEKIRKLARTALVALGWTAESPLKMKDEKSVESLQH